MTLLCILGGILGYLVLAVGLGRLVAGRGLGRLHDDLMEETLPGAPTGDRARHRPTPSGRIEWTEATNLTAVCAWTRPDGGRADGLVPDPAGDRDAELVPVGAVRRADAPETSRTP